MGSVDVEGLFRKFTVHEISDIERTLKSDVERKKEDLRQMVGRRYRDIIDAADNIRAMKESADSILHIVRNVQQSFDSLQSMHQKVVSAQQRAKNVASKNATSPKLLASIFMQLFEDIPELIWDSIDENSLMEAAWLYMLGLWLHDQMLLKDHSQDTKRFLEYQKLTILAFKQKIIKLAKDHMKSATIAHSDVVLQAATAYVLLEGSDIEKALLVFLDQRRAALEDVFKITDTSSRQQIISITRILMDTILLARYLFTPEYGNGTTRMYESISQVLSDKYRSDKLNQFLYYRGGRSYDELFDGSSNGFQASTGLNLSNVADVRKESCLDCCNNNIQRSLELCKTQLVDLLKYSDSVDALRGVKETVLATISEHTAEDDWNKACEATLGKQISLWADLFNAELEQRLKLLVCSRVSKAFDSLFQSTRNVDFPMEHSKYPGSVANFGGFLWSEAGSGDKYFDYTTSSDGSTSVLKLKALGYIPPVCSLIKTVDGSLKDVRLSLERYVSSQRETSPASTADYLRLSPTDGATVAGAEVFGELTAAVVREIERFADNVSGYVTSILGEKQDEDIDVVVSRALYCTKICACLLDMCPEIQLRLNASSSSKISTSSMAAQAMTAKASSVGGTAAGNTIWSNVKGLLEKTCLIGYRGWIDHTMLKAKEAIMGIVSSVDPVVWLQNVQEWEGLEVEDESEDGAKTKSKFYLPVQCSYPVHQFLMLLCSELNAIGLHSLPREVHQLYITSGYRCFLEAYRCVLKGQNAAVTDEAGSSMPQKQALQMVFELNVVATLLGNKHPSDPELASMGRQVLEDIEALADPFDLDILYSGSKKNVKRFVQKTMYLYGPLLLPDVSATLLRSSLPKLTATSPQEQSQIIPLRTGVKRFQLMSLPMDPYSSTAISGKPTGRDGVRSSRISKGSEKQLLGSAAAAGSPAPVMDGAVGESSIASSLLQKSTSFYDRISSGWFGM